MAPVPIGDPPPPAPPSWQARVGFWTGLINSGGLMLLGSYCLKLSLDETHGGAQLAAISSAADPLMASLAAIMLGSLGAVGTVLMAWWSR